MYCGSTSPEVYHRTSPYGYLRTPLDSPGKKVQAVAGAGGGDEFDYDPDWDGDWDIDRSLLDDDDNDDEGGVGSEGGEVHVDAAALGVVPGSDEEVTELTKSWVQAGKKGSMILYTRDNRWCAVVAAVGAHARRIDLVSIRWRVVDAVEPRDEYICQSLGAAATLR